MLLFIDTIKDAIFSGIFSLVLFILGFVSLWNISSVFFGVMKQKIGEMTATIFDRAADYIFETYLPELQQAIHDRAFGEAAKLTWLPLLLSLGYLLLF